MWLKKIKSDKDIIRTFLPLLSKGYREVCIIGIDAITAYVTTKVLSLLEKQIAKIYPSSFTFSLMGLEHCKEIKGYLSSLFPPQLMPQRDMRDMCFH